MRQVEDLQISFAQDVGLDAPFVKGQCKEVKNCWHFYTKGSDVDALFYDTADFVDGMNRVYATLCKYKLLILAFVLMDTHVHFVLYGQFEECNSFIHDYLRRISHHLSVRYGKKKACADVSISYQAITTDLYLKRAICYTVMNPTVAQLPYMPWTYPWSSGPLYFASRDTWTAPAWQNTVLESHAKKYKIANTLKLRYENIKDTDHLKLNNTIILPGVYVPYQSVERLFRSCKGYFYFLQTTKEKDVESEGGLRSFLSMPIQELREKKNRMCQEMFGGRVPNCLNMSERVELAKYLKRKYDCSPKQIARVCGLSFVECKDLL